MASPAHLPRFPCASLPGTVTVMSPLAPASALLAPPLISHQTHFFPSPLLCPRGHFLSPSSRHLLPRQLRRSPCLPASPFACPCFSGLLDLPGLLSLGRCVLPCPFPLGWLLSLQQISCPLATSFPEAFLPCLSCSAPSSVEQPCCVVTGPAVCLHGLRRIVHFPSLC